LLFVYKVVIEWDIHDYRLYFYMNIMDYME
jgi:hypothetical protein